MIAKGHWFILKVILPLLVSLAPVLPAASQVSDFSEDSVYITRIPSGDLFAYQDTIISEWDTLVIRKEVWLKTRDSLILQVDTLVFMEDSIYYLRDSLITLTDTIVIIQDTVLSRNERVLREIQEFTRRNTFFSRLLRNIFVFEEARRTVQGPVQQSDKFFEPYEGKIIRQVDIKVLDVFGNRLSDPNRKARSILEKSGNLLHVKTQKWIVRNQLLFEKGDTINSLKVSESERLLRENNFIYDARVLVKDSSGSDSVDVLVLVQDVWNISVGADADPGKDNYGMSLQDVNFLGLGHQLSGSLRLAPFLPKGHNYRGSYYISNIYKTFLAARLFYNYEYGQTIYGIGVNREFISPAIKWAGGINANWYSLTYGFVDNNDSLISVQPLRFIQGDIWVGYGWDVSGTSSDFKGSRLILSGRVVKSQYYEAPVLPDTVRTPYYTNDLFLSSIGVISRRFYKDNYIFRLGRTEDVPEGQLLSVTFGAENSFRGVRPYFGITGAWSRYYKKFGYAFGKIGVGGYREPQDWTQGVLSVQGLYFTPLFKVGNWKFRQFMGMKYTRGLNTDYGNYVTISNDQGLRGFRSGYLKGLERLVFNYELNFYPPLNFLGFRFALVLFSDVGWVTATDKLIDKRNFFPGFGAGLRFRNDHLIFSTVQIMLGYYPKGPDLGEQDLRLFETKNFFYNYYNFQFSRPSILPLN